VYGSDHVAIRTPPHPSSHVHHRSDVTDTPGRAVEPNELAALFAVCAQDPSPAGRPDAAMLARARDAVVKGAQPLEHNGYEVPLFQAVIAEELEKMAAG